MLTTAEMLKAKLTKTLYSNSHKFVSMWIKMLDLN